MIALNHNRIRRRFGKFHRRTRSALYLDIFLYREPVVNDAQEFGILGFLSPGIKTWRAKPDVIRLPFTGTPRRVTAWRGTTNTNVVNPAMIDATAI